jgi:hypothetical protein
LIESPQVLEKGWVKKHGSEFANSISYLPGRRTFSLSGLFFEV